VLKAEDRKGAVTWKKTRKPDAARILRATAQEGREVVERARGVMWKTLLPWLSGRQSGKRGAVLRMLPGTSFLSRASWRWAVVAKEI